MHSLLRPLCHLSFSFQQLSLSGRIASSQSSLLDRRTMFVLVSVFLVCLAVFLQFFSGEYHNAPMCLTSCGSHKTSVCFSVVFIVVSFIPIFCSRPYFNSCGIRSPTISQHSSVAQHFKSITVYDYNRPVNLPY